MKRTVLSGAILLSMLAALLSCGSGSGQQGYTSLTVVADAIKTSLVRAASARGKAMPSVTTVSFTIACAGA